MVSAKSTRRSVPPQVYLVQHPYYSGYLTEHQVKTFSWRQFGEVYMKGILQAVGERKFVLASYSGGMVTAVEVRRHSVSIHVRSNIYIVILAFQV